MSTVLFDSVASAEADPNPSAHRSRTRVQRVVLVCGVVAATAGVAIAAVCSGDPAEARMHLPKIPNPLPKMNLHLPKISNPFPKINNPFKKKTEDNSKEQTKESVSQMVRRKMREYKKPKPERKGLPVSGIDEVEKAPRRSFTSNLRSLKYAAKFNKKDVYAIVVSKEGSTAAFFKKLNRAPAKGGSVPEAIQSSTVHVGKKATNKMRKGLLSWEKNERLKFKSEKPVKVEKHHFEGGVGGLAKLELNDCVVKNTQGIWDKFADCELQALQTGQLFRSPRPYTKFVKPTDVYYIKTSTRRLPLEVKDAIALKQCKEILEGEDDRAEIEVQYGEIKGKSEHGDHNDVYLVKRAAD